MILLRKGARPRGYVDEYHELLEEVGDDRGQVEFCRDTGSSTHMGYYITYIGHLSLPLSLSPCTYRHGNSKEHFHPLRRVIGLLELSLRLGRLS